MKDRSDKWKIYIVGHKKIHEELMEADRQFNNINYTFLNVGQLDKLENGEKYHCINQKELPGYTAIGKHWAESEGIYNIWRSKCYQGSGYIGFLHYDIEFRLMRTVWGEEPISRGEFNDILQERIELILVLQRIQRDRIMPRRLWRMLPDRMS